MFFSDRYGLTPHDLERYLAEALSCGGEYADLYFEYISTSSLSLDESLIKSATQGISVGCGVRVLSGEKTGYAYTDDLAPEKILHATRVAAHIAAGPSRVQSLAVDEQPAPHDLYPVGSSLPDEDLAAKLDLLNRADLAARQFDPRIFQVRAGYADEIRHVMVATSDGRITHDFQPLTRLSVFALARDGSNIQRGMDGGGGRVALDFFRDVRTPEQFAREAARQAIVQLDAADAPAGEMTVVLGPGWPGILLHEAVGHGLEADFNRKKISAFSGLIGRQVASPLCTVVDDGTIPGRRGSLNVDDEGNPTTRTVLIEKGVLKGYLQDRLSCHILGVAPTGNGRRQSYRHMPMPRMTNTFMLAGEDSPEDIIRSVDRGLYCATFGGGQVDITSGKFVFSASESYLIEDGKITRPVRNATLIGNGPDVMTKVTRVGHDLKLDQGIGTCGKEGQMVPVGVGIPTIKVEKITVGGVGAA
ncbi:MAG TPA: metalloprotease TldD [Bryobacterales bacterium]|nr:metalloprotease TldD [Bryobacterales bacterium]